MSWWKEITGSGKTDTSGRMCEKGHPMDPNWKTCAYCEAEARATQKTVRPETADFESGEANQRSMTMGRSTTKIYPGPEGPEEGGADETRFDTASNDMAPPKKAPPAHQRRLTGVLVTFNWKSQGELFPLYEGRNVIGSKDSCDVCITTDKTMSGEHAVLLCRAGRDELHDLLSTNGTFLDEKYVERDGVDLTDGALIKTGATVFEFRKFTSGSGRAPERLDSSDRPTDYRPDTVL